MDGVSVSMSVFMSVSSSPDEVATRPTAYGEDQTASTGSSQNQQVCLHKLRTDHCIFPDNHILYHYSAKTDR